MNVEAGGGGKPPPHGRWQHQRGRQAAPARAAGLLSVGLSWFRGSAPCVLARAGAASRPRTTCGRRRQGWPVGFPCFRGAARPSARAGSACRPRLPPVACVPRGT